MLKFHLITDTHYYAYEQLGFSTHNDQVVFNESGAVLDAIFDRLLQDTSTDIVLIAGDLCSNGRRANSQGFVPKLQRLQAEGKRVFAITASHDYSTYGSKGDSGANADLVTRGELHGIYYDFGPREAIACYEPDPLSYTAQLAPGYRLLCLNTDRADEGHDVTGLMDWALGQVQQAQAEGQFIFAMHHYPVLPPSPVYPLLSPDIFINSEDIRSRLTDAGLRFVFTGHTHMQNIACMTTPAGNKLYDINTGAAVGCGTPIRTVTIDDANVTITTASIDDFNWDRQGKSAQQYLADHFDRMLSNIFEAANTDVERLLDLLNAEFRVNKAALLKYKPLLALGGKFLYRLTLGGLGRLLCCSVPKQVRRVRFKDFLMEAVRNIYAGDEPYGPETPMGKAVYNITGRLECFVKNKDLPFESLQGFVMSLIYDDGIPDSNAVLPL